jgi:3-deoxy-7-phosphoheptulonate synthase
MQKQASSEAVARVIELIRGRGLQEHISQGEERTIIGAVGDERVLHPHEIESLPEVERAIRVLNAWRIVSREAQPQNSVITVRGVAFGAEKMLDITTLPERAAAADAFFADPFYLPYSPYAAGGSGNEKEQVRAMQALLQQHHAAGKPVVLCKDKHHRADEWLVAAEHIALRGNHHIILGEAGTLSFEPEHTYRLDVDAIVRVRKESHLPVLANITRLWHGDMPQEVLYKLAAAAGADAVVSSLP